MMLGKDYAIVVVHELENKVQGEAKETLFKKTHTHNDDSSSSSTVEELVNKICSFGKKIKKKKMESNIPT